MVEAVQQVLVDVLKVPTGVITGLVVEFTPPPDSGAAGYVLNVPCGCSSELPLDQGIPLGVPGTWQISVKINNVDVGSRNHRAGELLAQGMPASEIGHALGQGTEAVDSVPLLASAARAARLDTPALDGLAALVEGRIDPDQWAATVTEPARPKRSRPVRAA